MCAGLGRPHAMFTAWLAVPGGQVAAQPAFGDKTQIVAPVVAGKTPQRSSAGDSAAPRRTSACSEETLGGNGHGAPVSGVWRHFSPCNIVFEFGARVRCWDPGDAQILLIEVLIIILFYYTHQLMNWRVVSQDLNIVKKKLWAWADEG